MAENGIEWKESVVKSIVYRTLTIILGFLTAYIGTGDIGTAFGLALLTEFVQSINYFIFEIVWTNLITRRRIKKELTEKIINLKINYDAIIELAYEMSQVETFVEDIYMSSLNFFNSILQNPELEDIHEQISKHKEHFIARHANREFASEQSQEEERSVEEST